ncbi:MULTISPECIES: hypothetical protein [Bacillus]|uniref:hypothetical protein n=1 Tax=Bacillus TaxID=1386 RepID=UPI002DB8D265|nr:hypothetical protein [Bacillus sp. AAVF1]MEC4201701.1 hypothetical protein [Bacillus sp. AAVF1]
MLGFLKDFAVYLAPVLSSYLTYLFLKRKSRSDKYEEQAKESLNEACGPLYFALNKILNKTNKAEIEFELEKFIEKYFDNPSSLIKLKERNIIDSFNKVAEYYHLYLSHKDNETYQHLMEELLLLKIEVENEFNLDHRVVNNGYKWFQLAASQENYWIRSAINFYRGFSQTVTFLLYVEIFLIYLFIVDRFMTEEQLLIPLRPYFMLFTIVILVCFVLVLLINYSIHVSQGKYSSRYKTIRERVAKWIPLFKKISDARVENENAAKKEFEDKYKNLN